MLNLFNLYSNISNNKQYLNSNINTKNVNSMNTNTITVGNFNNIYNTSSNTVELSEIALPVGISLAAGTTFVNIASKDKTEYVIDKLGHLVRKDGKKIVMNGDTAKHGAMFLKKASRIIFKGNHLNSKYYIQINPYRKTEKTEIGSNLSLIAK